MLLIEVTICRRYGRNKSINVGHAFLPLVSSPFSEFWAIELLWPYGGVFPPDSALHMHRFLVGYLGVDDVESG